MELKNCTNCGSLPAVNCTIGGYGLKAIQIICKECGNKTRKHIAEGGRFESGKLIPVTEEWATNQAVNEWNQQG